ncbi:MAG: DUF5777 family beta-barrel protein [Chitinophagales bacterium]|nr:DUF5777 family beta-barrel protein [Chitinophagales bacterium]
MNLFKLALLTFALSWAASVPVMAQEDDLLDLLNAQTDSAKANTIEYTYATFKTTRIISGQSIEIPAPGVMQFLIGHRFGTFKDGWRGLFGLDRANIRFAFEYGFTPWLAVGFGRSSADKMYDGSIKLKLLRQSTGKRKIPLTIGLYASGAIHSMEWTNPDRNNYFTSRMSYAFSLMIARKFNKGFSLQLTPTVAHQNLVPDKTFNNTVFAMGAGARQMVSKSLSINAEVFYLIPGQLPETYQSTYSIGIDLETGGHVFQFMITNARGMVEQYFVPRETQRWRDGDIQIGFNINRVFTVANYEKMQQRKAARKEKKS